MCARLRTQSAARLAGGNRPHSYRARSLLACRFRRVSPRAINSFVLPGRPAYVMERMKALADDLPDMGGPAIAKANRPGFHVRPQERRVGKECASTCRSGWSP